MTGIPGTIWILEGTSGSINVIHKRYAFSVNCVSPAQRQPKKGPLGSLSVAGGIPPDQVKGIHGGGGKNGKRKWIMIFIFLLLHFITFYPIVIIIVVKVMVSQHTFWKKSETDCSW